MSVGRVLPKSRKNLSADDLLLIVCYIFGHSTCACFLFVCRCVLFLLFYVLLCLGDFPGLVALTHMIGDWLEQSKHMSMVARDSACTFYEGT